MKKIVACEGCHKTPAQVDICQIRIVNYEVWNNECARQKELQINKGKKRKKEEGGMKNEGF